MYISVVHLVQPYPCTVFVYTIEVQHLHCRNTSYSSKLECYLTIAMVFNRLLSDLALRAMRRFVLKAVVKSFNTFKPVIGFPDSWYDSPPVLISKILEEKSSALWAVTLTETAFAPLFASLHSPSSGFFWIQNIYIFYGVNYFKIIFS